LAEVVAAEFEVLCALPVLASGSACTAGIVQTSHVLEAFYGPDSHRLKESVRISLSPLNTEEELKQLAQTLKNIIGD